MSFNIDAQYSRNDVMKVAGVAPLATGGAWFTGHLEHQGVHFIFCSVGSAGRTGHDYDNHFDGDELIWSGKTGSHKGQPSIQRIVDPSSEVHLFWRAGDRDTFTYSGKAHAVTVSDDQPVRVRWRFTGGDAPSSTQLAEEVPNVPGKKYLEGALKSVTVNAYERNPQARLDCLAHHGTACAVCNFDFGNAYGSVGQGFIHVHHLRPLAVIGEEYELDPVADLVPVCPNCHAMLHRTDPPKTVSELQQLVDACR